MQFQVPQFIEVEDKIFGPLTFRQFIYLGGGIGGAYILWRTLPSFVAGPVALSLLGLAAALAFLQFNGRPFIVALENGFFYVVRTKLYLWSNTRRSKTKHEIEKAVAKQADTYIPKLSESKLHELAWSLDIRERIASGTAPTEERQMRHPKSDALAAVRTATEARATKGESIQQQIAQIARERAHQPKPSLS